MPIVAQTASFPVYAARQLSGSRSGTHAEARHVGPDIDDSCAWHGPFVRDVIRKSVQVSDDSGSDWSRILIGRVPEKVFCLLNIQKVRARECCPSTVYRARFWALPQKIVNAGLEFLKSLVVSSTFTCDYILKKCSSAAAEVDSFVLVDDVRLA